MLVCNLNIFAQKVDTLYYDNNWKGVETKQFASFIRYVSYAQDGNYRNKFRTYFNTGELNSEGDFISIDKYDDSKSLVLGSHIIKMENCKQTGML